VRFSAAFDADPASILSSACKAGLEGVIAKRADAPYVSRRTETWLKLKCKLRQEFVVCGYTDRSDGSPQIGSLLLGVNDPQHGLVSVGSVGTGWDASAAKALKTMLAKHEIPKPPFTAGAAKPGRWSRRVAGSERWVEPRLVAEVEFAEWTPDGQIRHAAYIALRDDKPASAITRETARRVDGTAPVRSAGAAAVGGIKVSHGERVIDPSTQLTKLDLVRYYESVADRILPHLKGRPCSLVRGPNGVNGELFFQKHGEKIGIPGIRELDPALWPGHAALLEIATPQALAGAAQMNVIEFHTWNSTAHRIDQPDRMIFDLDPGEGTAWQQVQEAATLVRGLLTELGLKAWLKTSGGKGLHVVVPITPRLD
jgi:bifunctional non-homologous end joining protein LigD